ncbi:ficolin-2-like [Anopheles aquasalis]|uniref:ficolin-2-like n=1 Tax=Anopheles aquasalis TaxID=42839 RepID=UPI00215B244C|nr:ficolin-2-like [Anopheles aquasalis]
MLELLLGRFDDMDRKLIELQVELSEHREEVKRNRDSCENAIQRLEQDVSRNLSAILAQQTSCATRDGLRERLFNQIPRQNHSSYKSLGQSLLSFKSRLPDCVTPTSSQLQQNSSTPTTPITAETVKSTTTTPRTITIIKSTPQKTTTTSTTQKPKLPPFISCKDVPYNVSGVYLIRVSNDSAPFKVFCEMESYEGGWIVVQHRFNGSVDFYREWNQFRDGFGEVDSEFWLGLERIHQLTVARAHEIMFEMKDFEGNYGYARYDAFQIGSESEQYKLKALGSYSGTAGDSMTAYNKGAMFSTKDRDNDANEKHHLAHFCESAWWHGEDNKANLNGPYKYGSKNRSIWWYNFKYGIQLRFTRIMIRELRH